MTNDAPQKPIMERMWDFLDAQEKSSSCRNRIEFRRAKTDIEAALEEGWSGRMIWEQLRDEGRIRFGHSAFAKYVRTEIQGKPALGTPRSTGKPGATPQPPVAVPSVSLEQPTDRTFRVISTPRKEDLIGP